MEIKFDSQQQYQLDAINSTVEVFKGQKLSHGNMSFTIDNKQIISQIGGIGNQITINDEQILKNTQSIQEKLNLPVSSNLDGLNFTVEMETGTGKTYVYIRTIYELNKNYGFKKFVIVVPSIAIKEGVVKNLEITKEHFDRVYNNTPLNYWVYNSKHVSKLRNFAVSNNIEILVINIDSFTKSDNIINNSNDKMSGKKPIEFIRETNPIMIIDEPQNMETEKRKKGLKDMNPLCMFRYSATHINKYNNIYSLSPVDAYELELVKQIEVDSIVTEHQFNTAFISLEKVNATKTKTTAKVKIDVNTKNGIKRKSVTVKVGDDLYNHSNNREMYKEGYLINSIDAQDNYIELSNGEFVFAGEHFGDQADEVMKAQINKTVEEHFLKVKKMKMKGLNVKVLSLFFIDRVANYRSYDSNGNPVKGKFAEWFEEAYNKFSKKTAFKDLISFDCEEVHNGYFSQDRGRNWHDTKGSSKSDNDTYKLIMKDKERLLDSRVPLQFIFSHSALREGWDNPNVFQICTLNETNSELKKRQEIGRGLRLALDSTGERIRDKTLNRLTIIANQSYEEFATQLQSEIEDDFGVSFKGRIVNKKKRASVEYRKGFELDEKFKNIWNLIKYRTTYRVEYKTDKLIARASELVKKMPEIKKPLLRTSKAVIGYDDFGTTTEKLSSGKTDIDVSFEIPDVLLYIQEHTKLTRLTILTILEQSSRLGDLLINPQYFLELVVSEINSALNELIIDGIKYEKIGSSEYEMRLFEDYDFHVNNLTFNISKQDKTIYSNLVPLDSKVEYDFAKECETRDDIEYYFKMPSWFKIKTPIGNYNPDWAVIKVNNEKVYFVAETKSEGQELRLSEEIKVACGEKHFSILDGVEFRKVSEVSGLD